MDNNSNITTIIMESINTILGNLFSSIDTNVYDVLDDITFISSDIIHDSFFEKILGTSASNGTPELFSYLGFSLWFFTQSNMVLK